MFTLPKLPYDLDALEPHISRETLDYHYSRHHRGYVDKLNQLIEGTDLENMSLEAIVRASSPAPGESSRIFNNAAQAWNHQFYWQCMTPGVSLPNGALLETLNRRFGSVAGFWRCFSGTALNTFGSGWVWLVVGDDGDLEITSTGNAATPLTEGKVPLLTCDVWEHAYYIDYRNARAEYLQGFWSLLNWDFMAACLRHSEQSQYVA
jgi:Fe-Mn family superoxide dismutase